MREMRKKIMSSYPESSQKKRTTAVEWKLPLIVIFQVVTLVNTVSFSGPIISFHDKFLIL